jgi:hypothetical protein
MWSSIVCEVLVSTSHQLALILPYEAREIFHARAFAPFRGTFAKWMRFIGASCAALNEYTRSAASPRSGGTK